MEIIDATSTPLTFTDYEEIVEGLDRLEVMPAVAHKLLAATADQDFDIDEVTRLINCDVAIAARILKVASSPAYSTRPVTNLRNALIRIGMRDVRKLIMAVAMLGSRRLKPFRRQLWEYSLRVAATCEALCGHVGVEVDDPFLCGLLHDLGTLVFDRVVGADYRAMVVDPGGEYQLARERERFGFDHSDLGALVARKWRLFPALESVLQLHHDPLAAERIGMPLDEQLSVFVVALARAAVIGASEIDPVVLAGLFERLGLDDRDLAACGAAGDRRFESIYRELLA